MAQALQEKGELNEAIAAYREAIRLKQDNAEAHNNLGLALAAQRKWNEAIEEYREAIRIKQDVADAHCGLGYSLMQQGEFRKAVAALSECIKLRPDLAQVWHVRAFCYVRLSGFREALADYEKTLELLGPNAGPGIYNDLAWLLATCPEVELRKPSRAVELAKKAVELAPKAGGFWNTLGVAHYRLGEEKAAVTALHKSMDLRQGGDAIDWLFLAMAHCKLGDLDEARKWYDKSVQWLEKNSQALDKDPQQAEELRRLRDEAEQVLELNKK